MPRFCCSDSASKVSSVKRELQFLLQHCQPFSSGSPSEFIEGGSETSSSSESRSAVAAVFPAAASPEARAATSELTDSGGLRLQASSWSNSSRMGSMGLKVNVQKQILISISFALDSSKLLHWYELNIVFFRQVL